MAKKTEKKKKEEITAEMRKDMTRKIADNIDETRRLLTEARALSEKLGVPLIIPADVLDPNAAASESAEYWQNSECWGETSYENSDD